MLTGHYPSSIGGAQFITISGHGKPRATLASGNQRRLH